MLQIDVPSVERFYEKVTVILEAAILTGLSLDRITQLASSSVFPLTSIEDQFVTRMISAVEDAQAEGVPQSQIAEVAKVLIGQPMFRDLAIPSICTAPRFSSN